MKGVAAIVLAGGLGKRMKSRLPKVLHPAAGRPLVHYPVAAAVRAGADRIVVVVSAATEGPVLEHVLAAFGEGRVTTAVQASPLGTGDAAAVGLAAAGDADRMLI